MPNRRDFLGGGAMTAFAALASPAVLPRTLPEPAGGSAAAWANLLGPERPADAGIGVPVHVPDVPRLHYERDGEVKVFHLRAEVCRSSFLPGWDFDVWGYNACMPGPTIEVVQGDRVRIHFENRLPEATSMHWHGLEVPIEMDGVPGVTQDPVQPGGSFTYEFTVHQNGTFFYHSHMGMQQMMGMIGLFIIHPRRPYEPHCDKDFGLILQGWAVLPNNTVPNSLAMEFNWLTLNGRAGPHATPLIVRRGERVRIRFVNLGMDHHPMHLHGNTWVTTGTEGGRVPRAAWTPGNTELVGVAQARDVELVAEHVGDWMLHCHLPHHMMNHMASMVGPMAHGPAGMGTGGGMPEGMGMSTGSALGEENAPTMGRAIGLGAMRHQPVTNLPLRPRPQEGEHDGHDHHDHQAATDPQEHEHHAVAPGQDPMSVPGYPQDHFMVMDERVAKPETHGMRPTWSGGVMGMMTVVRVLEPEMYERVQALRRQAQAGAAGGAR